MSRSGCRGWRVNTRAEREGVDSGTNLVSRSTTLLKNRNIELAHLELGAVTTAVRGKGKVGEHEVLRAGESL
jgi:hypothetical protein